MQKFVIKVASMATFLLLFNIIFSSRCVSQPPENGLVLWIAADSLNLADGAEIPSLINLINSSPSTTPVNKASISQLVAIDDHAAIDFAGVEAFYDLGISVDLPLTTFVFYYTASAAQQFFYDTDNRMIGYLTSLNAGQYGANLIYNFTSSPYFKISTFSTAPSGSKIFLNGALRAQGNSDRPISNSFRLGCSWPNNRYYDGYIAEVLIYNYELSDNERNAVEAYLMDRYSPPVRIAASESVLPFCTIDLSVKPRFKTYSWSKIFDEGNAQILGNQSVQSISQPGKYAIKTTDIFDRISTDTITVSGINTDDLVNSTTCLESGVIVDLGLIDSSFTVEWNNPFLNGSQVEITEPGDYSVLLTQPNGCSFQSNIFTLLELEEITGIEMPELFCSGNSLEAMVGYVSGVDLLWSTGETTNSITPTESGEYWVEATNANGCVGRDTVDLVIAGAAPTVEFTTGTACANNAVVFTDETFDEGSGIVEETWVFPFGSAPFDSAQGPVVEYIFTETGSYPIELTVLLANGCSGTGRDTVVVHPLPLVGFNDDSVIPCAGNEVAYESQSGVPGNGQITAYSWLFGNGTTDTGVVGTTVFESLGVNTVQLTVTTSAGCVDSLMRNVVVLGSPVADFDFAPVCVGMATVFEEDVDTSESGSVFYNWQFGDGFFSNFPNTSHVYAQAGVYNVQLTATGNDFGGAGCVDKIIKQVRVYAAPTGGAIASDGCLGEEIVFSDITQPVVLAGEGDFVETREWVLPFGYGQGPVVVGGDSVQVWDALEAGDYAVKLNFITGAGCVGTASTNVDVFAIPEASFSLDMPTVEPPFSVAPVNTSVDAEGFVWMVNGEVVSTDTAPELLFAEQGDYVVTLVAANGMGCNDTTEQAFVVIDPQYDLGLLDIRYTVVGDRLELRAVLSNNGNVGIGKFDMRVQLGLSANVDGVMDFYLGAGEVREFLLPQTYEYLPGRDLPYVCMEVGLTSLGLVEVDLDNNGVCIGLEQEKVVFIDPYPNPTVGVVKFGFVLPVGGDVGLRISDSSGREVSSFVYSLEKGYSLREFRFEGFSEGVYFVRYSFLGEEVVKRVVVVE